MREPNDWRFFGQDRYLRGATVTWVEYPAPTCASDHDHCAFCFEKFMLGQPDTLTAGYVTTDGHWICKPCFEDFKQEFEFKVE